MIGHLVACLWWGVSQGIGGFAWFDNENMVYSTLRDADLRIQYLTSAYWAITTLTTTGYGDITPVNTKERILAIIVIICGATLFGYVVGKMANLMGVLSHNPIAEKIDNISVYLSEKNCSKKLSKIIIKHFYHKYIITSNYNEKLILSRLSRSLINNIELIIYNKLIKKIIIFKYINNNTISLYIFNQMIPELYDIGQYIIKEKKLSNGIYFILDGNANIIKGITFDKKKSKNQNQKNNNNNNNKPKETMKNIVIRIN